MVLTLFLLSRLAIGAWALMEPEARMVNGDSALYMELGRQLLEEGAYEGYVRPPGYPALIAAVYAVLGTGWWGYAGLLLLNLAGGVALWFGVMRLAGGGFSVARSATLLMMDLAWLLFSKEILTETLFTPLIVWMVAGMVRGARNATLPSVARSATLPSVARNATLPSVARSATLLGLATLLKPITFYLPWVLVPYLFWRKWPVPRIALFVLISAGIPFLWQVRNYAAHGTLAYTSIASENLMTGHAAFTLAAAEGLSHSQAIDSVRTLFWTDVADPAALQADEAAFNARKSAVARRILADHPLTYAIQIAKGMVFTLIDPGREVWERTFGAGPAAVGITETIARDGVWSAAWRILTEMPFLVLYVLFLAAVYGWTLWRLPSAWKADPALTVLLLLLIAYFLVLGGPIGYARFRLYVFPLILVLFTNPRLKPGVIAKTP